MSILATNNLTYTYPNGYTALKDVSVTFAAGSFTALLGANGSGKTTLFQNLNGLLTPTAGEVLLAGRPLPSYPPAEVFQRVGLVFQDPNDQLFAPTVYEDVSYGPLNAGLPEEQVRRRVQQALMRVEMWERRRAPIGQLSYGQRKRVAVAGMLALAPEVLILDEPTAGLDPRGASALLRLLQQVRQESGMTIIIATHEVDDVPVYCDYAYVLAHGRVCRAGTPEAVFAAPQAVRDAQLRLPRVSHLVEILRDRDGLPLSGAALTIRQARRMLRTLWRR